MSTLEDWLTEAAGTLELTAEQIDTALRTELLDLTRDVAHNVARVAGPLTCYLAGIAGGRGADPHEVITLLSAAAKAHPPVEEASRP